MTELIVSSAPYVAGVLMLLGYVLYIRQTLRHEIEPNPTTWTMFAYGTGLLTVLEADRSASFVLLIVPAACALCGLWVAGICLKRGKIKWPDERENQISFVTDLLLTIAYITAWLLLVFGQIVEEQRAFATLVFLVCSNLTTITAFIPLLRQAKRNPGDERAFPWVVWTFSYATLAVATFYEAGLWTELMIYPIMNTFLHGLVATLALPHRRKQKYLEELERGYQAF